MNKLVITLVLITFSVNSFAQDIVYDKTFKQYIIAEFSPLENDVDNSKRSKIQQEHMAYIKSLAENGNLVMAGPYPTGGGLFFLNTSDEVKAKEWIEKDPTIKNAINSYTLKKWVTEKGLFTLDNTKTETSKYGKSNPKAPKETMQYGQLVGEWDIDVSNLTREGDWIEDKANWKFTYILDGYAIQDFWTKPAKASDNETKDYLGTNIRIYNPETKKWKCTWVENGSNDLNGVWTSYQNDKAELILHDETKKWEIKFYNITKTSFDWKWDFKLDDGSMQTRVKIKAKKIK